VNFYVYKKIVACSKSVGKPNLWILVATLMALTTSLSAKPYNQTKEWGGQCSTTELSQPNIQTTLSKITNAPYPDAIYLEADDGTISIQGTSELQGNIIIQRNGTIFNAEKATFNRKNNSIIAEGNVILSTKGLQLKSQAIEYKLKENTGIIKGANYTVGNDGAHGSSVQIKQLSEKRLRLKDATFTTCPANASPLRHLTGADKISSWNLASSNILLNQNTQIGYAKNVTFNVLNVPVFYFPWLKFPINNQRLSGFLSPTLRLETNAGISIPYYFNFAPNYDATVTVSTLSGHGVQFDNEFRYLTPHHNGKLNYIFIPEDKAFDSPTNDKRRDYFEVLHNTRVNQSTSIKLHAEGVSDNKYFDDFSTSLESSSRSALQRRLEVTHNKKAWQLTAAVEDYQILDAKDAPYAKLPEIKLQYSPLTAPNALKLGMQSELVYFDKTNAITGSRADLKLTASKKWGNQAWFIKPAVSFEHTLYSLNNTDKSSLSRSLPTLTVDTGLFFDRDLLGSHTFGSDKNNSKLLFNKALTQTLEPRLFYTYTPYKDQSELPIFDTSETSFSETTQLFSANRFTGRDRIADANQITFAVTSRIQDRQNGKELLKGSIGQIFYFSDKTVNLLPQAEQIKNTQTNKQSNLVLELSGRVNNNLQLSSIGLWDQKKKSIPGYELRLNYQDKKKRILNVAYRNLKTELQQFNLSTAFPINDKWSVTASTEHDVQNDRNLETLVGVEYKTCCVKTRFVAKRYLSADNKSYETPIFIEFELKGLGNIGTGNASNQLKDKIYGYDDY